MLWDSNPRMGRDYFFLQKSYLLGGSHSLLHKGYWGPFPDVQRKRRHVDQSALSSAESKTGRSCTSALSIYLHGDGRDNFTVSNYAVVLYTLNLWNYVTCTITMLVIINVHITFDVK
jgi:hypothetical protein